MAGGEGVFILGNQTQTVNELFNTECLAERFCLSQSAVGYYKIMSACLES